MRLVAIVLSFLCASTVWAQSGDPCAVMPKSNVAVSITTATTTQLIAAVASQAIYVCGVSLTIGTSTSAQFEYGTKVSTACDTGANAMSGIIPASLISTPTMNATQMVTPVSQSLCIVSVGTGGIHGYVSYVQW